MRSHWSLIWFTGHFAVWFLIFISDGSIKNIFFQTMTRITMELFCGTTNGFFSKMIYIYLSEMLVKDDKSARQTLNHGNYIEGRSEHNALMRRKVGDWICSRHLFKSKRFLYFKAFLLKCAPCSELSSQIITMYWTILKPPNHNCFQ